MLSAKGGNAVCPEGQVPVSGTLPTAAGGARANLLGPDGSEIVYPVPLFVRNTFIEAALGRPVSLDGFFEERQALSCPVSCISQPGSASDGLSPPLASTRRVPYRPGETLTKSAGFGPAAPLAMIPLAAPASSKKSAAAGMPEPDSHSECSTADTLGLAPSSPVPEKTQPQLPLMSMGAPWAPLPVAHVPCGPPPAVLRLEEAINESSVSLLGSPELPSVGSGRHGAGQCKPCAFVHTKGCASGADCKFCHICGKGEKQRRQKEKRAFFGAMRQIQKLAGESWPFAGAAANPAPQSA